MERLTIGQLSQKTGVSRKAIRLYEETGLVVPEVQRSNGNYRVYNENHLFCINCIKQFQSLGISLEEMKQLLIIFEKIRKMVEPHLQHLLREKLMRIDEHIEELQKLRQHVASFLDSADQVFTHMEGIQIK